MGNLVVVSVNGDKVKVSVESLLVDFVYFYLVLRQDVFSQPT